MPRIHYLVITALLLHTGLAQADIAMVTNADNGIDQLSQSDALNIFMGRYRKLPNGALALPIDLVPLKARFYHALVNKDLAEINSYWARLVFSGQGSPPQQADSAAEVINLVVHNPSALSYVDAARVTPEMRVVLVLHE
ncbi:hypothetical protein [Phytohalomonas tamaricis]|uniref:hypothetical protein n=1 Tax=Phytohalomonas tamaricis TaxID=2081032 RepID=UPI000D0B4664|nr:hypothetical protein [Phytohalomonas tamaricis]